MQSKCISGTCNITNLVKLKGPLPRPKHIEDITTTIISNIRNFLLSIKRLGGIGCEGVYKRLTKIALTTICGEATN